jgi:hypothetical protein
MDHTVGVFDSRPGHDGAGTMARNNCMGAMAPALSQLLGRTMAWAKWRGQMAEAGTMAQAWLLRHRNFFTCPMAQAQD